MISMDLIVICAQCVLCLLLLCCVWLLGFVFARGNRHDKKKKKKKMRAHSPILNFRCASARSVPDKNHEQSNHTMVKQKDCKPGHQRRCEVRTAAAPLACRLAALFTSRPRIPQCLHRWACNNEQEDGQTRGGVLKSDDA